MKRIGIIDSGIGGLSILRDLLDYQYDVQYYYQSDHRFVPYGGRSQLFMLERTKTMVKKLLENEVELIVMACNTLTVETIETLREQFAIPFVGIEPYVNYLNHNANKEDEIGIILTEATSKSEKFLSLRDKLDPEHKLKVYPLKRLALIIEQLSFCSLADLKEEIEQELEPLKEEKLTHLILGCTHYPLVSQMITKFLNLKTIDPHDAVAKRVGDVLKLEKLKDISDQAIFYYAQEISDKFSERSKSSFSFL